MIICPQLERCGRLGNQLWQVASTIGISRQMSQSVSFPKWDYQPFFRVPAEFFEPNPRLIQDRELVRGDRTKYVEHMDQRAREYLQDYGLWADISQEVWNWLQPSTLAFDRIYDEYSWFYELDRPTLSVHVRRGDNAIAPNNCHPLRPWSYYQSAIEQLRGEFNTLVVFSDDPEWCKQAFAGYEVEYPVAFFEGTPRAKEHEKAYRTGPILDWIDLQVMSLCDRHVISNSTYSWWGAFLSHDPSPIYPMPFFGSDLDYIDTSLMMPNSWIAIDHGQQYV